ncbi:MAG: hypothetical protein P0Y56_03560 [Candidatus Andeanibacterium colombiense]|uniref:Transferrin-binding protein B C-lobe/N-lobe beta barrel domain-containing protein n=1 Tax=Candidatus Andeanibacterium colombiense TaxID=3121345 RepID=A0AAJ5X7I6_9SPHN|nr:MAG: hypothetical protein P0Y56_03560 [Sphingomonadaceae bacterium]
MTYRTRFAAGVSLLPLGLLLAACGGGGVNSTPTPTPTPGTPTPTPGTPTPTPGTPTPTPATNDDLIGPLVSDSFKNVAGEMAVTKLGGTSQPAATASKPTLALTYDAASNTYTLTVGGRSKTFAPGDLSAAKSTSQAAVYEISAGGVTDTLTLTKPGTSGRFTYQYVGGAFWQRVDTAAHTAFVDVAAYGIQTPNASVPRAGSASYAVDVMGYETRRDGKAVNTLSGSGQLDVDFAKGIVVTSGTFASPDSGPIEFDGKATLSSNANGFTGVFSFYDYEHFTGTLEGRFYGPAAQEVGAVVNTQDNKGDAMVGVIIGRKDSTLGTNSSFVAPDHSQFFTADTQTVSVTHNDTTETYSGVSHGTAPVTVHFDPVTGKYMLISGDRAVIHTVEAQQQRFYPVDQVQVYQSEYRPSFKTLKYVTGMSWASRTVSGQNSQYDFRDFVYGFPTANSSVPKTGLAAFELTLGGTIVDKKYDGVDFPTELAAQVAYPSGGVLLADFGAGTLSLNAGLDVLAGHVELQGQGTISSAANGFTGTLTADGPDNDLHRHLLRQVLWPRRGGNRRHLLRLERTGRDADRLFRG